MHIFLQQGLTWLAWHVATDTAEALSKPWRSKYSSHSSA